MRAVVFVTGDVEAHSEMKLRKPISLLACVDRPILQHVVEVLIERGVSDFDFVLNESPDEIEAFLGDGKRWGSSFTFHLARDPLRPYRVLKLLNAAEPVLVVHSDCLPNISAETLAATTSRSVMFCKPSSGQGVAAVPSWTGWAWLDPAIFSSVPANASKGELEAFLFTTVQASGIELVSEALDLSSFAGVLEAQRSLLTNRFSGVQLSARQVEPAIWISRNVVIHPTAALTGPLFVGDNSRIGAGARIGPNAVIGHDSVIDRHTTVQDAAVLPGSYCGEGLELDHVFVDRNRLVNVGLNTAVNISDSFILGTMKGAQRRSWGAPLLSRCLATILFVLTLPVLAVVWLARHGAISRRDVVKLPAISAPESWMVFTFYSFRYANEQNDVRGWRCLLFDILPNLLQVARGRLRFVGVQPRSPRDIESLPEDWRALYLQSQAGLITEAAILHGAAATVDEIYSSEAYYSAMAGPRHDFGLAVRFLAQVVHLA